MTMQRWMSLSFCLLGALTLFEACGGAQQVQNELENALDTNNDGKPDAWQRMEHHEGHLYLAEKRYDLNFDGKLDVIRLFDVEGNEIENRLDLDFDGHFDVNTRFEEGQITQKTYDANFDGQPDIFQYYEGGQLLRIERDLNFDGQIDHWEHYNNGQPVSAESDDDGDGKPDHEVDLFENEVLEPTPDLPPAESSAP